MVEKRPALGRGLSALIPDSPTPVTAPAADRSLEIDTDLLRPNKFQPRTHIDDDRIEELSRSIRSNGIIQPIVVRKTADGYEIVAGERRWRAAQRAGLLKVPVVVRDIPEDKLLAVALIENIQREDLNPIEEAIAYRRLVGRVPPDPGADRGRGRQGPLVDRQLRAAAPPAAGGPRQRRVERAVDGPRARAARARRRSRRSCASPATSSRAASRSARPKRWSRKRRSPPVEQTRDRKSTCTPAPPKKSSRSRSAPARESSAKARAAASRSTSRPRTSCSGSTSCSRNGERARRLNRKLRTRTNSRKERRCDD